MNVLLLYTIEIFLMNKVGTRFIVRFLISKKRRNLNKFAGCLFVSCIGGREKNF